MTDHGAGHGPPDSVAVFSWSPPQREVLEPFRAGTPLRHASFRDVDPAEGLRLLDERGLLQTLGTLDLIECAFTDATVDVLAGAAEGLAGLHLFKPKGLAGARAVRFFGARAFRGARRVGVAGTSLELAALRALWKTASTLDELRLYDVVLPTGRIGRLSRAAVGRVHIEARLADAQLLELVRGLGLDVLRELTVHTHGSIAGFFELVRDRARAGQLGQLTALDVEGNHLDDTHVATFLEAPPPALTSLVLSRNGVGLKGMEQLAAWARSWPALRRLAISGNFVGSGEYEEGTDWDGTVVGSYERGLSVEQLREKAGFPKDLRLF